METLNLSFEGESERVDKWLTQTFNYSRNFFHHIISREGILINGKVAKKSQKLKTWDQIQIDNLERYLSPVILDETPKIEIPILRETLDYLIINKPKGVLSHPNSVWDLAQPSVVGFLYHHYQELPSIGNFIRAGIIHRLDKETDGLMIIAKSEAGLAHFKNLFKAKSESESIADKAQVPLQKYYRACCKITDQWSQFLSEIEHQLPFLIIEEITPKVANPSTKLAITQIQHFAKKSEKEVEIDLQIFTGRTHQIRIHLSSKGLPIIGDYLYGQEDDRGMQLTAYKLVFQDLEGKSIEIGIE